MFVKNPTVDLLKPFAPRVITGNFWELTICPQHGGVKGLMIIFIFDLKAGILMGAPPQVHRSFSRLFHALGAKGLN